VAYSLQIATATIYMEASGEGPQGELAVAHVLLNRQADGRWGKTLAQVCLAPEQFSCWNTTDPNRRRMAALGNDDPALLSANAALGAAQGGAADPTRGATHYYSAKMPSPPEWAGSGRFLVQIGNHRFYDQVA